MRRSGFTMIELIFVIVILGILASVAIPKLAATRDDAKVSKVLNELATLKSDMSAYYTSRGTYTTGLGKIQDETNVALYPSDKGCNSDKAQEIISGKDYYYCVENTGNKDKERLITIQPRDENGTLGIIVNESANGNIARIVKQTKSFKTLAVTVQNGGSRINY